MAAAAERGNLRGTWQVAVLLQSNSRASWVGNPLAGGCATETQAFFACFWISVSSAGGDAPTSSSSFFPFCAARRVQFGLSSSRK